MREVVFAPAAVRHWKKLPAAARSLLRERIRESLVVQDPTETTRNRFRPRRASPHADYELRIEPWRVFYRVTETMVYVELIGKKKGNRLIVEGKEFEL
jgi:mRNA-degrading endonuclease RelE of RelBE toxin-antitoxin system